MNRHQLNKKLAKQAVVKEVKPVEKVVKPVEKVVTPEVKTNAVKEFIKSITPEVAPDAIKPSDFLIKKKKPETK